MKVYIVRASWLTGGGDRSDSNDMEFETKEDAIKYVDYMNKAQEYVYCMDKVRYEYIGVKERSFHTFESAIERSKGVLEYAEKKRREALNER